MRLRELLIGGLMVIGAAGGAYALRAPAPEPLALVEATAEPTAALAVTPTAAPIVVFVSGAVVNPGVYTLPPGSRVVDALEAAGGPTDEAAYESLNQATTLSDGMQVHMPVQGEAPPPLAPVVAGGMEAGAAGQPAPVHLNSADAATLETLPGIGPALAARIVEYRSTHGPFTAVEQLLDVQGIGEKLLESIRGHVVLD